MLLVLALADGRDVGLANALDSYVLGSDLVYGPYEFAQGIR